MHAAIVDRLRPERRAAARRLAVELLEMAFLDEPENPATWRAATALIPHVVAILAAGADDPALLWLVATAAFSLWAQGDYASARRLEEAVLAAPRRC